MANPYDDPDFFAAYQAMRAGGEALNDLIEQPCLRSLLPPLRGLRVLDIGCGSGGFCRFAAAAGAASVAGIDPSERMLAEAQRLAGGQEQYALGGFEALPFAGPFDLVVSSLALHYTADLRLAFANVASVLRPGGAFVFSSEHPLYTAGQGEEGGQGEGGGWIEDGEGRKRAWAIRAYAEEGPRASHWFIDGVVRQHRTVATIVNALLAAGFVLEQLLEPHTAPGTPAQHPRVLEQRLRPAFLLLRARRLP